MSLSHLSLLIILLSLSSCQRSTSVSGVWREVTTDLESQPTNGHRRALYELNLGQYGDRVAGVSVRYQKPNEDSLASFDIADRCNCSFVVQGLIEALEESSEGQLLFVANGLTFSLYTPIQQSVANSSSSLNRSSCSDLPQECQRIFDLEQTDGGDILQGYTWCLESPEETRRPLKFLGINGISEDACESE